MADEEFEEKLDKKIKELFETYDSSGNGSLDYRELVRAMHGLILKIEPNLNDEQLDRVVSDTITLFDDNHDESIELDEFSKIVKFLVYEKGLDLKI